MTHFFLLDLATGICLVKSALLLLADSPLIVDGLCFISAAAAAATAAVTVAPATCRSLLTFWLFPSLLFGCLLFSSVTF